MQPRSTVSSSPPAPSAADAGMYPALSSIHDDSYHPYALDSLELVANYVNNHDEYLPRYEFILINIRFG